MLLWELPPGLFALSGLYYNPEHLFILAKSLYSLFSCGSQNSSVVFYVFNLVLSFSKALGFCGILFAISVRSLIIYTPISSFCLVLELSFSGQSHNLHPLIPCWCKILVRLSASSLSSSAWRLTLSSYSCSDSSLDPFGHFSSSQP